MFKRKPVTINHKIYETISYIKYVLIILFVYLTFLVISEGIWIFENINNNAVGKTYIIPKKGMEELWQYPKKKINVVGADLKNSGFKNQTNILKSSVPNVNVTEEL